MAVIGSANDWLSHAQIFPKVAAHLPIKLILRIHVERHLHVVPRLGGRCGLVALKARHWRVSRYAGRFAHFLYLLGSEFLMQPVVVEFSELLFVEGHARRE